MPAGRRDEVKQLVLSDVVALHHETDYRLAEQFIERRLGANLSVTNRISGRDKGNLLHPAGYAENGFPNLGPGGPRVGSGC
jgi:hypothetical protein